MKSSTETQRAKEERSKGEPYSSLQQGNIHKQIHHIEVERGGFYSYSIFQLKGRLVNTAIHEIVVRDVHCWELLVTFTQFSSLSKHSLE